MQRMILLALLVLSIMLAACTGDLPSDLSGCKSDKGEDSATIYDKEFGCLHGIKKVEHGAEAEGEHSEEGAEAEGEHSEEGEPSPSATAEATPSE
jgi:hypothetical protein